MTRESLTRIWRSWFVILCMVAGLFWACPGFASAAGNQITGQDLVAAVLDDTSGAALEGAPSFQYYSSNSASSGWDYGDQLSGNEMQIYKALESVTDIKDYYYNSSTSKNGISITLSQPYVCAGTTETYKESSGYQKAQKDWNRATHAYIKDYGEMYWIYYFLIGFSYSVGSDCVIIDELILYPKDYYSEIRSELGITDEALSQAVQKIGEVSGRYEKVKAAHDYVAELVTYNSENLNAAYGHTITGGLLEKYNHLGVCECYAKIFRLLCEENGIPCILVAGGKSTDSSGNVIANHMWNYVQMEDGNWYVVDVTWDDQSSGIYTNYFLAGYNSQGFNGKKVGEDHLPVGCFSSSVSYDAFILPAMAMEAYDMDSEVKVTGITLDQTEMTVEEGSTSQLNVSEYLPENANTGIDVNYVSSNSLVAPVDTSGKITGKTPGTAVITVSSRECPEVKAQCTVTVRAHVYSVTVKEATCLENGVKRYTCTNAGCLEVKEETIAATGHTAGEWETVKEATCTEAGQKVKKCTACQEVLEEESITAPGHSYGSWQTKTDATCESAEVQERICSVCGAVETQSCGSAKGHTAGDWVTVTPATCTEDGQKVKKCTVCQEVLEEDSITAPGHSYGAWETKTEATCESAEVQERTCSVCGVSEIRSYGSAKGHTAGEWKVAKNATGSKAGVKEQYCSVCGKKIASKSIPKTKVTLNASTIPLQRKKSTTVLKIKSYTAGDTVAQWTSDKPSIVSVNKKTGKLTAKKNGKAVITVKMKSGATAKCIVKVQSGTVKTTKLTVSKSAVTLKAKQTHTIKATRTPITSQETVKFSSSNKKVATVSGNGKITAKKKGSATITVKSGKKSVKVKVTVK